MLLLHTALPIAAPPSPTATFVAHAHQRFLQTRQAHLLSPTNSQAAWHFARACFELAEFATNHTQRADLAERGIQTCRRLLLAHPNLGPAHYYLAMNLGQLARTKTLGALKIVPQMEAAFKKTVELDPHCDFAGADRNLALLYRDAPGWPTSIGSRRKSVLHFERCLQLHPEYPGNRLTYLESLLDWGQKKKIQQDLAATQAALDKARLTLTGEDWASSWAEWEERWTTLRRQAGKPTSEPRP